MSLSEQGFTGLIPILDLAEDQSHRLKTFSSNRKDLDAFLTDEASAFHSDHLSHTSLLFHEDFDGLVGYITLTNDAIPLKTSEVGDLGLAYKIKLSHFPAIKICRLAIHKDLQCQRIGARMLYLAIGEIVGTSAVTTARLLITDAVNDPRVLKFYESHGFLESFWAVDQHKNHSRGTERATIKMIRDIYSS